MWPAAASRKFQPSSAWWRWRVIRKTCILRHMISWKRYECIRCIPKGVVYILPTYTWRLAAVVGTSLKIFTVVGEVIGGWWHPERMGIGKNGLWSRTIEQRMRCCIARKFHWDIRNQAIKMPIRKSRRDSCGKSDNKIHKFPNAFQSSFLLFMPSALKPA